MVMTVEMRPVASIKVTDRVREIFGDLRELEDSLRDHGLINPVTIQADGTLVAGERRLRAARELDWAEIAVNVLGRDVTLSEALAIELEENTCRLELTLAEKERAYEKYTELRAAELRQQRSEDEDQDHPTDSIGVPSEDGDVYGPTDSIGVPWRGPRRTAQAEIAAKLETSYGTMQAVREVRETAEDETEPESVREVARQEYAKLAKETRRGATPALDRVRLAKRQATREAMSPGQWLKSDEPKAPPKAVNWQTRLWDVVASGQQVRKTAEELELDPDTGVLAAGDLTKMTELLQEQIRDRQYLRKVLLGIKKGRK